MGNCLEFGPPALDLVLRVREGNLDDGLTDRPSCFTNSRLPAEKLTELARMVESWGWDVVPGESEYDDAYVILGDQEEESPWEAFGFSADGGTLSNPTRDEDDVSAAWNLITEICDYAGWIVLDPEMGIVHGVEMRCPQCQGSLIEPGQETCCEGHPVIEATIEVVVGLRL